MMRLRRNASILAITTALLLSATGCGGGDEPTAEPTAEPTETSTSDTPTESPSPTESAWEDKYTKKQLDGYEAALTRWEIYETRSEPIWASGKATERAEPFFKQYFPSPLWQKELERLRLYAANNVTVSGTPTVYWSKPTRVTKNLLNVEIQQCVDFSDVVTTQRGEQVAGNRWTTTPHLRVISLSKPEGYDWLIYSYGDPEGKKKKCTP
jgi:hypothetical protein